MARKSLIIKAKRKPKFKVRAYTRCSICGRPHSVYKDFGICRICLKKNGKRGVNPWHEKSKLVIKELKMMTDIIAGLLLPSN